MRIRGQLTLILNQEKGVGQRRYSLDCNFVLLMAIELLRDGYLEQGREAEEKLPVWKTWRVVSRLELCQCRTLPHV